MSKNLIAIILALAASTAQAGVTDLTWEELQVMDHRFQIDIHWPKAGNYKINTLCVVGDEFRTLEPVKVCLEWKDVSGRGNAYHGPEFECVRSETRVDTVPRSGTRVVCTDLFYPRPGPLYSGPICRRYEEVPYTLGTSQSVEIYGKARRPDFDRPLLGVKTYEIPACR